MPFIQRDGRNIYYVSESVYSDKEDVKTIIFIHTNVMDHSIYDKMVACLRHDYHIVRYDLAGFGRSELGNVTISLDLLVDDLSFLVQSLQLPSFYVIAIGFGGLIALEYNKVNKGKIEKMVLMSMPCFPEETLHSVRDHRKKISLDGTYIPADNILKKTTLLAEDDPEYRKLHRFMSQLPISTYTKMMELTIGANTIDYLRNNTTPTLILAGEREIVFPQHWLVMECALLPLHRYTTVPNSSSFLMVDQPEVTSILAKEFFQANADPERYRDETSISISESVRQFAQQSYDYSAKHGLTSSSNKITIDLFHTVRVTINGTTIKESLNQRYAKNILTYLLFHPTTTREDLCDNLWPDVSVHRTKKNLRVYLSYLRNIINSYSTKEPILVVERESIQLHGELTSDLFTLLSDLQTAVELTDSEEKYKLVKKIFDQFHSQSYLTSIHDQWFLEIRTRIESELANLAVWLGEWLFQQGNEQGWLYYLTKALYLVTDNIKIYDTIIALYEKKRNEEQRQYWLAEKRKAWDV